MENTPGPGGYLLAWVVSVFVYAALFAAETSIADGTGWGTAFGVFVIYGYFIGAVSMPFALVGVAIVHLVCRKVAAQSVHVLVAGVTGFLPSLCFSAFAGEWAMGVYALVPIATAVGRWSVVPLVRRRRAAADLAVPTITVARGGDS